MTEGATYHLAAQRADVLLGPIAAAVRDLEARTTHYLARLELASPADAAALREAHHALHQAAARIAAATAGPADGAPPAGAPRRSLSAAGDPEPALPTGGGAPALPADAEGGQRRGDGSPRSGGEPTAGGGATGDRGQPEPGAATAGGRRKRVLVTGAGGRIGRDLSARLAAEYDLRLMYHRSVPEAPPSDDWMRIDTGTVEAVLPAMAGIDAVVHLAGEPDPAAPWARVLEANIVGAHSVFEAARIAGVRRIVFASTNHVMGMYDRDAAWPVYSHQPVRPDSLYGVSKAFGEALGRFYADQHGMEVVCLRIGWFLDEPLDEIAEWMWLSPRDGAQVVRRAIEADIRFGTFYAISANAGRRWDITDTIERLGYRPEDDAARHRPQGA